MSTAGEPAASQGDDAPNQAEQIACLLTSGLVGRRLLSELYARFGTAKRSDVFLGAAMAATLAEADLVAAVALVQQRGDPA